MERLEDLAIDGYKIYQDDELYTFTSDAVLLSRFATVKKNDNVADLCSGCGIVGIHLYALNPSVSSVTLFEMQKELFDLSVKSIKYNSLDNVISAENVKVQDIPSSFYGKFSLAVCNPPYMKSGSGENDKRHSVAVCRREITLTLAELCEKVGKLVKFGGRFCMVHRADRLCDVITEMRKNGIEPKRLQFVRAGKKEPYLLLIEGVKGGKSGIKIYNETNN